MCRDAVHVFDAGDTHLGVFQRNGVRKLSGIEKTIDAHDFARQQEAGDLYLTDGIFKLGFDRARPYAVNGSGGIALMEKRTAFRDADTFAYNLVELDDIVAVDTQRQTKAVQHAC